MALSLLLVLGAWTIVLCLTPLLHELLGARRASLFTFGFAAAVVMAARRRRYRPIFPSLARGAFGFAAGFTGLPAWVALITAAGLEVGLAPAPPVAPAPGETSDWLLTVAVAPLLEELLYRERLLVSLLPRFGSVLAVAISSALFALPHVHAWDQLGTAIVGIGLGTAFRVSGSIELCVGLHAGLNAAVLVCGLPPARGALPLEASALLICSAIPIVMALGQGETRRTEASG